MAFPNFYQTWMFCSVIAISLSVLHLHRGESLLPQGNVQHAGSQQVTYTHLAAITQGTPEMERIQPLYRSLVPKPVLCTEVNQCTQPQCLSLQVLGPVGGDSMHLHVA